MLGQGQVMSTIGLVEQHEDEVETRKKSSWQVDVFMDAFSLVVAAIERIGSCQDRSPSIESGGDSCFCNRNCLLLHHLMNGSPVILFHLVELVDTADTHIGEH